MTDHIPARLVMRKDHIPITSQPPWPENHPVPVKGGGEVPGPVDVDALERRMDSWWERAGHRNAMTLTQEKKLYENMLTALRQQQDALKELDNDFDSMKELWDYDKAEVLRLRAEIEEAIPLITIYHNTDTEAVSVLRKALDNAK